MLGKDIVEALTKSGLTAGLSDPEGLFLQVRQFTFGETVCRRAELADKLWIVMRGRLVAQVPNILRQRPAYVPYEIVGDRGVLVSGMERSADLISDDENTLLLEIHSSDIEKHPQSSLLYRNLAAINSDRLLSSYKDYDHIAAERAELLETLKRFVGTDFINRKALIPESYRDCTSEQVVIWFSDIVGFSSRSAGIEPARVAAFIREAMSRQIRLIQAESGYVDKLIGDGLMAYWPARFHDDGCNACQKAVSAALATVQSLSEMSFNGSPISVRVGLNYGTVFAGEFGTLERAQYTLIGEEVNKAARLESARDENAVSPSGYKLGMIRISKDVYLRLSPSLQKSFPAPVILNLKGISNILAYTTMY